MPKTEFAYHVEVCRVSYGTETLTIVGAENEEDAGNIALDKAGNLLYKERNSKYEVLEVWPSGWSEAESLEINNDN